LISDETLKNTMITAIKVYLARDTSDIVSVIVPF